MNIEIFLYIILVCIMALFILAYLNGNFTYTDEIYSTERYQKIRQTKHISTGKHIGDISYDGVVERIVIKRTYVSGRIKFIEKEVKI